MRVALNWVAAAFVVAVTVFGWPYSAFSQAREYDDLEIVAPKVEGLDDYTANQAQFAKTSVQTDPEYGSASDEDAGTSDGIDGLITYLTIFVLAIFVGFEVITKVPPTLHTPLMSGSNAISGITIIGAILAGVAGNVSGREFLAGGLAFAAAALAMINVVGGFVVTDRMLQMFRKKDRA